MYSSNLWNSVVMVRVSRYGTGARGTWQRLSFTYFASISPSNFSWHSSLSLVRSMHSFNWCCMFPFVIIFKKISIQKENTCYSITIGEQDYSQENSCVAVSFSKGCRTSALTFIKKTPTKVVSCEIWTPFLQNTSSGCLWQRLRHSYFRVNFGKFWKTLLTTSGGYVFLLQDAKHQKNKKNYDNNMQ